MIIRNGQRFICSLTKKKPKPRMQSSSEDKLQLNMRNEIKKLFLIEKKEQVSVLFIRLIHSIK